MTTGGPSTRDAVVSATARRHRRQIKARWWRFGFIALAVVIVDQATKLIIRGQLAPREVIDVFPGFSISRVANEGIAFGLFPGRQAIVAVLTVVALSAIAVALAGLVARNAIVAVGAGLLVGGYFGSWLADPDPWSIPMSVEGLRRAGASLGAGSVVVLPEGACGLRETARVSRYLALESAGQCGPCVFGLSALADAAAALAGGRDAAAALRELTGLPQEIEGRGACAHPDGAARLTRSALRAFPYGVDLHLRGACSSRGAAPVLPIPAPSDQWR